VADDALFAPGGRVVIRTYGVASAATGESTPTPVSYRTWVTGVRDQRAGEFLAGSWRETLLVPFPGSRLSPA
jgi:hypothetical protein